jgi:hypothetical protein
MRRKNFLHLIASVSPGAWSVGPKKSVDFNLRRMAHQCTVSGIAVLVVNVIDAFEYHVVSILVLVQHSSRPSE